MRRRYVYDADSGEMVEVGRSEGSKLHYIQPDIQEFVSPVDGTVIRSRKHLRRYMKERNLAHVDDFSQSWEQRRAERLKFREGRDRKSIEQRIGALRDSFEHVRNRQRAERGY